MRLTNPFTAQGQWYKANLHTHTTVSDGTSSPPQRVEEYAAAGYSILAITDHNKTSDVRPLNRPELLVIGGVEYHPRCPSTPQPHHLVGLNVPFGFSLGETYPLDGNACILAVKEAGGESILAHPLWCGHRYDQYNYLDGYVALEVHNSTCDHIGRSNSEADWCHILDAGQMLPAVAVDDTHRPADLLGGWTWFKLRRLNLRSFMHALRTGCYYSSTGPKIHGFQLRDGQVEVSCSPAQSIYLVAQTWHGSRRLAEAGRSIRGFTWPVGKDWSYVRAVVLDSAGKKAWTNPIALRQ